MKMIYLFILSIIITGFSACVKTDVDATAPTLTITSVSPLAGLGMVCGEQENNVINLVSGDTLSFDFLFKDNQALSQYKIDIHDNFECHGHKASTNKWVVQKIENLSGTSSSVQEILVVPNDVTAGAYHCSIQLLDESGNKAATVFYTLQIQNQMDTVAPTLSISQPSGTSITVNKGAVLNVQGTLSDNMNLADGKIEMHYFGSSGDETEAASVDLTSSMGTSYNFTFNYTIPNSLPSGTYTCEILAYDGVRNLANDIDFDLVIP